VAAQHHLTSIRDFEVDNRVGFCLLHVPIALIGVKDSDLLRTPNSPANSSGNRIKCNFADSTHDRLRLLSVPARKPLRVSGLRAVASAILTRYLRLRCDEPQA
jgi:hypothetical protein